MAWNITVKVKGKGGDCRYSNCIHIYTGRKILKYCLFITLIYINSLRAEEPHGITRLSMLSKSLYKTLEKSSTLTLSCRLAMRASRSLPVGEDANTYSTILSPTPAWSEARGDSTESPPGNCGRPGPRCPTPILNPWLCPTPWSVGRRIRQVIASSTPHNTNYFF